MSTTRHGVRARDGARVASARVPGAVRRGARLRGFGETGGNLYDFKVSPLWLLGAYGVLTAGELMLSPMGLALVSKVAPRPYRGTAPHSPLDAPRPSLYITDWLFNQEVIRR